MENVEEVSQNLKVNKLKRSKILSLLGIVILVTVCFVFIGRTVDDVNKPDKFIYPSSGYFTYESKSAGFSIDYPVTYEKKEGGGLVMFIGPLKPGEDYNTTFQTTVFLAKNSAPDINLNTASKDIEEVISKQNTSKILSKENVKIGDIPAIKYVIEGPVKGETSQTHDVKTLMLVIAHKGSIYRFAYTNKKDKFEENLPVVEKMIETINLDYTHKSYGKTNEYSNSFYGFKFKYPSDWEQCCANPNLGYVVRFFNSEKIENKLNQENVSIRVTESEVTLPLYVPVRERNLALSLKDFKIISKEETILSGLPATKILYEYDQGGGKIIQELEIIATKGKKIYILDYFPINESNKSIVEEIIKSFSIQ